MRERWQIRLTETFLNDPRDWPLFAFLLQATLLFPLAIAAFLVPLWWPQWWVSVGLGAAFLVVYSLQLEQFITMFHDANHHPLFCRRFGFLNRYISWFLGPLYGSTPNSYYTHHVLMHHPANNLEDDESSTMAYQRDSFVDFVRYWLRFFCSAWAVCQYILARYPRGSEISRAVLIGEGLYFGLLLLLLSWRPGMTLVVMVLPLLVTRTMMIVGNWAEHAFVDPAAPDNLYRSSTDLIGEKVNAKVFNVGYHIGHHIRPGAHFSTQPMYFEANKERYGQEDAVVLEGINYPQLWFLLMSKNYDAIAERFVQLPGAMERTKEEVIAMLRSRVEPIR